MGPSAGAEQTEDASGLHQTSTRISHMHVRADEHSPKQADILEKAFTANSVFPAIKNKKSRHVMWGATRQCPPARPDYI